MKKTVILLHTPESGVGKSTLANYLIGLKLIDASLSFAKDIKQLGLIFHSNVSNTPSLSVDDFFQDRKDEKIINGKSPRDITCLISDLAQEVYGQNVWAKKLYKSVKHSFHNTFIVDDWRRYIESDYLRSKEDINLITVYLTIDGLVIKDKSKEASAYEANINPEDCDLVLTYKEDYSNFNEVVNNIVKTLG